MTQSALVGWRTEYILDALGQHQANIKTALVSFGGGREHLELAVLLASLAADGVVVELEQCLHLVQADLGRQLDGLRPLYWSVASGGVKLLVDI